MIHNLRSSNSGNDTGKTWEEPVSSRVNFRRKPIKTERILVAITRKLEGKTEILYKILEVRKNV